SAWSQRAMHFPDGLTHIVDEVQRLRDHKTVEGTFRQETGLRQVADNGCLWRIRRNVKDILTGYPLTAETPAIGRVADFQCAAPNIGAMSAEELFHVVTIDRHAAIETENRADRLGSTEISEIYVSDRGWASVHEPPQPSPQIGWDPSLDFAPCPRSEKL